MGLTLDTNTIRLERYFFNFLNVRKISYVIVSQRDIHITLIEKHKIYCARNLRTANARRAN
jgi:hypothetical protein